MTLRRCAQTGKRAGACLPLPHQGVTKPFISDQQSACWHTAESRPPGNVVA